MARRKLIAGNWKMNGGRNSISELRGIAEAARAHVAVDVAIALPATLIGLAAEQVPELPIGAQDVHAVDKGPHTGCISAGMIREAGARFSIVGHSERRCDQHETDAEVRAKAEALHRCGLGAILCVGEQLADRDAGRAEAVVTEQLAGSLPADASGEWLSIAYEPIWAIGTGRTPTVEDVAAMHGAIRARLHELIGDAADGVRLLYGGSVTGDNAGELLAAGDVDGALVGGASLTAAKFAPIIAAGAALA
ncbi:triose-phosphate isomerase [Sphingomonas aracearum]|uniref:Triosephosphate isomerase n=1 Tax=Sphingomonas aracearum TaxID=2283317 RepID=A0A369VXN1_9SPHN|nr:triose-phosphate isomerase [Sphingomonas aracearum]RDE06367.1 triose-phosphate isomerase [Sphingomonas aracearum]